MMQRLVDRAYKAGDGSSVRDQLNEVSPDTKALKEHMAALCFSEDETLINVLSDYGSWLR